MKEAVLSHSFALSDNVAALLGDLLTDNCTLSRLWLGQFSQIGCNYMTQCFSSILPGNIHATDFELYDIQGNKVRYREWEEIMERNRDFARWLDDYDFESLYDIRNATLRAVDEVVRDYYAFQPEPTILGMIADYTYAIA